MLVAGPSQKHPDGNHRIEFMVMGDPPPRSAPGL